MPAVVKGPRRFHGAADDGPEVDRLAAQRDLAAGDAADVEQVVHEAAQVAHLPLDDLAGPGRGGIGLFLRAHHGHGVTDGREGVAQLVAEHGQELVDLPAFLFQRLHAAALRQVARHLRESRTTRRRRARR
jgi:hypothetical protein